MFDRSIRVLKSLHHLFSHYAQITKLFRGINSPTYSPDKDQVKSKFSVIIDYLYLFFGLKVLPTNYHLFQFDSKGRNEFKEYMDGPMSPVFRHKLYKCLWDDNYSSLVNDKYLFHCFCRYHGIPVPEIYGVCQNGALITNESNFKNLISEDNPEKVVLKPRSGMQGKGIHFVSREIAVSLLGNASPELYKSLPDEVNKQGFIIQEFIKQHPELDEINPHSLNTIRILTFLSHDRSVKIFAAMLRTSSQRYPIDNYSLGGIVVGVDIETGRLKRLGFQSPEFGRTSTEHPLTRLSFYNFQIPFWEGLKETAVRAQKIFHYHKSIGWDFAISRNGPFLIEGNIEWGTAGIQAANGGLLTPENRALFAQYGLRFYE